MRPHPLLAMVSPVPAEFVPPGIEPPNAPNFTNPQLITNIQDHVAKIPTARLRTTLNAFMAYKDELLLRVLKVYAVSRAMRNEFGCDTATWKVGSNVPEEAEGFLNVVLTIPLKVDHLRELLNVIILLYANDRVSTWNGSTVDAPGVFLRKWLTTWRDLYRSDPAIDRRGLLDGIQIQDWFARADTLQIDAFLVIPSGHNLARCFKKLTSLNISAPVVQSTEGEPETKWEDWLHTWTKENEDPGVHRTRLYKVLDALWHLRSDSPKVDKFRSYDTEHFMRLLEDLGISVSDAIDAWAKVLPSELPSLEEAEAWGAKVHDLCMGMASYQVAMRSALGLLKRVACECGKNSAQVRAPKRKRLQ